MMRRLSPLPRVAQPVRRAANWPAVCGSHSGRRLTSDPAVPPPPKAPGRAWTHPSVRRLLRNPRYRGCWRYGVTETVWVSSKDYARQVVESARGLGDSLLAAGLKLVSGGTDNHLLLCDVSAVGVTGKDAEAAMALSLGKPVIFFCDATAKSRFYRDVHPLSRLIDFSSGVAVGAIVASSLAEVTQLLYRIFENKMEYELEQPKPGYYRLKEKFTESVVRVQTNDDLLRETFWNYYHNRPEDEA